MEAKTATTKIVQWSESKHMIQIIREAVFVREQGISPILEWDNSDAKAIHVLTINADNRPVGTGRLLPDGHIGRLAVIKNWRGKRIGTTLLETLVMVGIEHGYRNLFLHAQTQAISFYRRLGFIAIGEPFVEANILHQKMQRQ